MRVYGRICRFVYMYVYVLRAACWWLAVLVAVKKTNNNEGGTFRNKREGRRKHAGLTDCEYNDNKS